MNLFKETTLTQTDAATATGTTEIASTPVDTAEFDGVAFIFSLGSFNAGNYVKVQGCLTVGGTYVDIAGSKFTPTVDATGLILTVERSPAYRFYKVDVVRAGVTSIISAIFALLYRTKSAPLATNKGSQSVGAVTGTA